MTSLRKTIEIREKIRTLNGLGINKEQRRELIKESTYCFAKLIGINELLKEEIELAHQKGLSGDEAYNSIRQSFEDYPKKILEGFREYN